MKYVFHNLILLLLATALTSCAQKENEIIKEVSLPTSHNTSAPFNLYPPPISEFIRRIFEDSSSNLWLGTNGDGVFKYDGNILENYNVDTGFSGYAIRAIVEDNNGDIWFGTSEGVIQYNGTTFKNYTLGNTQRANGVWSLIIDYTGTIWVSTEEGVSTFDGVKFTPFTLLPETPDDFSRGVSSGKLVHDIMEDTKHRIWFATNSGVFIYENGNLTNLSVKDGLCHNAVNDILEDKNGDFWFATHYNGVCKWNGKSFTHFNKKDEVTGDEAWSLYEDQSGNIWFPIEHTGIYKYDGNTFTNYNTTDGLSSSAIQTIYEDSKGNLWIGGYQGLSRYNGKQFIAVTKMGGWK